MNRITGTFRALKNRNYRLFFTGQGISLIGTWMQQVAISWLVYRITGSSVMLGVVGFCLQIPTLFLFPLTGILADRLEKRRLLIATQACAMAQAGILAILVFSGTVVIWHIIALSIMMGVVNAFDMPARQSFVIDMVKKREDLSNAIALNSTIFNGARLIGPTVAGAVISSFGEELCFLLNSVSYMAVIFSLMRITVAVKKYHSETGNSFKDVIVGTKYTFGFAPVRSIILLLALISLTGMPYSVLLPVFAKIVLHGDAHTYGMMSGASGLGALAGALYLASRKTVAGIERVISVNAILFGLCLCLFSVSGFLPLSLLILVFIGFTLIAVMASSNTLIQTIVEDSMRGRVMAVFNVAIFGIAPFGSLAAGSLAHTFGPKYTLFACGLIALAGASIFAFQTPKIKKLVHPIYVKKGVVPAIANGIQKADSATEFSKE